MPLRAAPILTTAVLVLLLGAANAQAADPVLYRCGPQGQDLRDTPCPDDPRRAASALPRDTVTPAEAAAARKRAADEARATDALRKERERQEAARPRSAAAGIDGRVGQTQKDAGAQPAKPSDPKKRKPKDPKPSKPKPAKPPKEPKVPKTPKLPKPQPPVPSTGTIGAAGIGNAGDAIDARR